MEKGYTVGIKIIYVIICLLIPLCGFAQTHLPHPQPGVTSPSEIPRINDPLWKTITSWPKKISKGKITYSVEYSGYSIKNEGQRTTDIDEIDMKQRYAANYSPNYYDDDVNEDDYYYGPFFGWRPDGTLYLKQMTDEYGNHESYYLYPDGCFCQSTIYDRSRDLFVMSYYKIDGTLIGYYIIKNEWTPDKSMESECWWEGKVVSEEELKSLSCGFAKNCLSD